MKKEDMKKLYGEEKIDLKTVLNNILVVLLITSAQTFSQVPINGFCKYTSYPVEKGYTNLFTLNFNNDSYTDLILYNPFKNSYISLLGTSTGTFSDPAVYSSQWELSKIQNISASDKIITSYAFSSRRKMKAGIIDLSENGRINVKDYIGFKSFPENIISSDVNNDGNIELLVSGSSFQGFSLLSMKENKLNESKFFSHLSFSESIFADWNNDGYDDVAAFEIFSNSIRLYRNNSRGNFSLDRSIPLDTKLKSMRGFDINYDTFQDIIFCSSNSINILFGDALSPFTVSKRISTKFHADKFTIGDYNNDGLMDFAYTNLSSGILSLIFARNDKDFYPEIIYLKKNNIKDITNYYSKFISGIAVLSEDGSLYIITKLSSLIEDTNISLCARPEALNYFDYQKDGIQDLCYIDSYDSTLQIIIRNKEGIPSLHYKYQLFRNHNYITVDYSDQRKIIFYLFSSGSRLIEVLTLDLFNVEYERTSLYSPGKILDLKIKREENNLPKIFITYARNNITGASVFEFKDFRYVLSDYPQIAADVLNVSTTLNSSYNIYFWTKDRSQLTLKKFNFDRQLFYEITRLSFDSVRYVASITGDLLNKEQDINFTLVKHQKLKLNFCLSGNYLITNSASSIDDLSSAVFYLWESKTGGIKRLFCYDRKAASLLRLSFLGNGKKLHVENFIPDIKLRSYFIKKMNYKDFHLVYTNSVEDCITIKTI